MKTLNRFKIAVLTLVLLGTGVTSCIEEGVEITGQGKSRFRLNSTDRYSVAVIEAAMAPYTLINIWRDVTDAGNLGAAGSVSLELDNQIITDWNTANGTTFEPIPPGLFTIDGPTLNFDAGVFNLVVKFTPNPEDVGWDYGKAYALGVKLTSPSTGYEITGGESQAVIAVVVKNAWEANYAVSGYFFHPGAPRGIADSKDLLTVGPSTSEAGLGDLYGAGFYFNFDVSLTNTMTSWVPVGSTPDPGVPSGSSGFMTMDNPGGTDYSLAFTQDGVACGDAEYNFTNYNNTYNPTTMTFSMHYGYRAVVVGTEAVYTRQCYEKWVKN